MIAARSRYFDDWDFPLGLVMIFGLSLMYAMASALVLRAVAEKARQAAIDHLHEKLVQVKGEETQQENQAGQIEMTIEEIESSKEGAFAPLLLQPVFGAFLIPSGGITLLALLDYLAPGK